MKDLYVFEDKAEILNEVARITNYEGAKATLALKQKLTDANGTPYSQIFTADADNDILDSYFEETATAVATKMDYYIAGVDLSVDASHPVSYKVRLDQSAADRLIAAINDSISSQSDYDPSLDINADGVVNSSDVTAVQNAMDNADGWLTRRGVGVSFIFRMPDNFKDTVRELIIKNMKWALVNGIVGSWFAVSFTDKSEYYLKKSEALITNTREELFRRNRPLPRISAINEKSAITLDTTPVSPSADE